jgi:hypothetical protein
MLPAHYGGSIPKTRCGTQELPRLTQVAGKSAFPMGFLFGVFDDITFTILPMRLSILRSRSSRSQPSWNFSGLTSGSTSLDSFSGDGPGSGPTRSSPVNTAPVVRDSRWRAVMGNGASRGQSFWAGWRGSACVGSRSRAPRESSGVEGVLRPGSWAD